MKQKNILEQEYGELVITEKTRENIKKHPEFYVNSPVKVATARIYTNEEFEKKSDEILKQELQKGKTLALKKILKPKKK